MMKKKIKPSLFLIMLFVASVVFYGYFASRMSLIVFYPSDESRYLAGAKSLHYLGNFSRNYVLESYDDVLYSFILSFAYFFYSPENILRLCRFIGVIMMSSVIFPSYLLAKKMEIGKLWNIDGAFLAAIISIIIPELTYSSYLLAETLLYPLFMWMLYFAYIEFQDMKMIKKVNYKIIFIFILLYATKNVAISFVAAYCAMFFLYGIIVKDKKIILKSVLSGLLFLVFLLGLKGVILITNGSLEGHNHYAEQAMAIFPFSFQVFVGIVRGGLFYLSYFILFTGVFPIISLCSNLRKLNKNDILWASFLLTMIIVTIIEVVLIIHYSENGTDPVLSRFHYRYLFYFFLPMLILFIKYKTFYNKTISLGILIFEIVSLSVFFVPVNKMGQGICDGIACYFVKNLNVYAGFTDLLYLVLIFGLFLITLLLIKNKERLLFNIGITLIICMLIIMFPFAQKIPGENSRRDEASVNDAVKIAYYINQNAERVICINTSGIADPVMRYPAYNIADYEEIALNEDTPYFEVLSDNTIVLISGTFGYGLKGDIKEIDLGTKYTRVYVANRGIVEINRDEYTIDFSAYGNLQNGYDADGIRYLVNEGISFGPYIELSKGKYLVEVIGKNLKKVFMSASAQNGNEILKTQMVSNSDTEAVLTMELLNDVSNFEFLVKNGSQEVIALKYIKIKKTN